MFKLLTNINKKIDRNNLENYQVYNKNLINFYGEEKSRKVPFVFNKRNIKNDYNKKIAILNLEYKKEMRNSKKTFSKIKINNKKLKKAQIMSSIYDHSATRYKIKSAKKILKNNKTFTCFLKMKYKALKTQQLQNLKYYKNKVRGIKLSGDNYDYKKNELKKAYIELKKNQIPLAEQMQAIDLFFKSKGLDQSFLEKYNYLKDEWKSLISDNKAFLKTTKNFLKTSKNNKKMKINNVNKNFINSNSKYKDEIKDRKEEIALEIMKLKKASKIEIKNLQVRKIEINLEYKKALDKIKKDPNYKTSKKLLINEKYKKLQAISGNKKGGITLGYNVIKIIGNFLIVAPLLLWLEALIIIMHLSKLHIKKIYQKKYLAISNLYKTFTDLEVLESWNKKFYEEKQKVYQEYADSTKKVEEEFYEDLRTNREKCALVTNKQINDSKIEFANFKKAKLQESKVLIEDAKKQRKKRQISYKAYKNFIKLVKNNYKDELKIYRNKSIFFTVKLIKSFFAYNLLYKIQKMEKEKNNKIEHIQKSIPIETFAGIRYFLAMINFVFGGLAYLITWQFKKAFIALLATSIIYYFSFGLAFNGFPNVGGNGLFGLQDLGNGEGDDARYFLVIGTYSYVLILVTLLYMFFMFFSGYKIGLLMEKGIRPNTWFITKKVIDKIGLPYLISIPAFLITVFVIITPLLTLFLVAFTNWGATANPTTGEKVSWIGFENFSLIFSDTGFGKKLSSEFLQVFQWTMIWSIATFILGISIQIAISMLVNSKRMKMVWLQRTILILPTAIPIFIIVLLFKILLIEPTSIGAKDGGPLYHLLLDMNLFSDTKNTDSGVKIVNSLTQNATFVKIFLIFLSIWFGIGNGMLFYTGLLQGISPSLYEAAEIDGASTLQKQKTITIPHLFFIIIPLLIPWFIGTMNNFSLIWLFNNGGPIYNPPSITGAGQSDIILSWVYKLVKNPERVSNSMGITAVICIVFGSVSILAALPGVMKSKMFREGEW